MIRYFNPGHETAVLNGSKFYMAPANVMQMQGDLAYLPAYYSTDEDFVFVQDDIPWGFLSFISETLGVDIRFITKNSICAYASRLSGLSVDLWGISPQALHLFDTLNNEYDLNLLLPAWDDRLRQLCSRNEASKCLSYLTDNSDDYPGSIIPRFFSNINDIEHYLDNDRQTRFLLKAPFSSSGRGLLWLPLGGLTRTERQIIHGHLKKQGQVSLERVLHKKVDFAMEFLCCGGQVDFRGFSLFQTNTKGGYVSNYIGQQDTIIEKLSGYIDCTLLKRTKVHLLNYLQNNIAEFYSGYIGVDMMVYEDDDGMRKLQPCVEINARNNMGILAMNMSRRFISENSEGYFYIDFSPAENQALEKDISMKQRYPLVVENKKIKSGYFSLCPVTGKTKYRAYVLIYS